MKKSSQLLLFVVISSLMGVRQMACAQSYESNYSRQAAPQYRGQCAYAPAGLVIPVRLSTGISTEVVQAGEPVQATTAQDIQLGNISIPAGTIVRGQVTDAGASGRLGKSGRLGLKFLELCTRDGAVYPINCHLVGGIEKYHQSESDGGEIKGEDGWTKLKAVGVRSLVGAGAGAALGTAVGGIADGGHGAGRGAWSGTAIGAGLGAADSLLLRKGREVNLKAGTQMEIQLDSPVTIAGKAYGNM